MSEAARTENAEQLPPGIGDRLRRARVQTGLSARAFARDLGVSPSLISQIELGKAVPSVGTLYSIVSKLGISLDELFFDVERTEATAVALVCPDPPERAANGDGIVQRAAARRAIVLASGVSWERLTPDHDYDVDFLSVTYDVGAESCPEAALMTHSGKEYGLVLAGRLGATVGFRSYELVTGDSIAFESAVPHRFWTIGGVPCVVAWTIVGRQGDSRFPGGRAST